MIKPDRAFTNVESWPVGSWASWELASWEMASWGRNSRTSGFSQVATGSRMYLLVVCLTLQALFLWRGLYLFLYTERNKC
jgi:hypothetical protein